MADLDITQMTQLSAAPAADDVVYIGDVSEAVLDDQNKHIEIEDLFSYLEGGYEGNIVLNTAATLDLSVGAVHLNEAVDLLVTSTELNQLDGVSVGGSSAGDITTIDGTQILTNKALTTPTIGDLTNAGHDHSNAAGGGAILRTAEVEAVGYATACTTGIKVAFVADSNLNGLNLTNVLCAVYTLANADSTNTMDVQVVRKRGATSVDMLSTQVTLEDTEYYAQDGVINAANDDIATGDVILINISVIHNGSTAADGLFVTLEFS